MFIDSHAHFDICLEGEISEAELFSGMAENRVEFAVQVATEKNNLQWVMDFAEKHKNLLFTLGIHPGSEYNDEDLVTLDSMASKAVADKKKLFGIGEIGLDYHWMDHPKETQIEFFTRQVEIANRYGLPVIIHNRDAAEDTLSVLKETKAKKVLIHCFTGDKNIAKEFLDEGYYISFAGNVTFKKAVDMQEALKVIPDDRLLLETDCPFLTPVPHRGKKNRPAYVRHVYEFAAKLRNTEPEILAEQIKETFFTFSPIKLADLNG